MDVLYQPQFGTHMEMFKLLKRRQNEGLVD